MEYFIQFPTDIKGFSRLLYLHKKTKRYALRRLRFQGIWMLTVYWTDKCTRVLQARKWVSPFGYPLPLTDLSIVWFEGIYFLL